MKLIKCSQKDCIYCIYISLKMISSISPSIGQKWIEKESQDPYTKICGVVDFVSNQMVSLKTEFGYACYAVTDFTEKFQPWK